MKTRLFMVFHGFSWFSMILEEISQKWPGKWWRQVGETQKAQFELIWWQKSCLWRHIFVRRHIPSPRRRVFFLGGTPDKPR